MHSLAVGKGDIFIMSAIAIAMISWILVFASMVVPLFPTKPVITGAEKGYLSLKEQEVLETPDNNRF